MSSPRMSCNLYYLQAFMSGRLNDLWNSLRIFMCRCYSCKLSSLQVSLTLPFLLEELEINRHLFFVLMLASAYPNFSLKQTSLLCSLMWWYPRIACFVSPTIVISLGLLLELMFCETLMCSDNISLRNMVLQISYFIDPPLLLRTGACHQSPL